MIVKIAGTKFCSKLAQELAAELRPGDALVVIREPENRFDRRAIRVMRLGHKVGYVPADKNRELSRAMDERGIEILNAVAGLGRGGPTVEIEPPKDPAK